MAQRSDGERRRLQRAEIALERQQDPKQPDQSKPEYDACQHRANPIWPDFVSATTPDDDADPPRQFQTKKKKTFAIKKAMPP